MGAEYTVIRRVARLRSHLPLNPLRILLCGSPGAGKRTLAAGLARRGLAAATVSGGENDTRRLVEAAAAAEIAAIVVDARDPLSAEARRHSAIARLLGLGRAVLVVNKMDLVDWAQERFDEARATYEAFARAIGIEVVACVPVSATADRNLPALLEQLQLVETPKTRGPAPESPARADQFEATIAWFGATPLLPGRDYLLALGATTATATITPLKHKVNLDTFEHVAANRLEANEIGVAQLELAEPIAFEPYERSHERGGFTLLDRFTRETVGAGMIRFALRRSQNVHWQAVDIDRAARAAMKGQRPCTLWFTGLSGAGKSTIANLVEKKLHAMGRHTYLLDGDNVRHGLNKDLGFTEAARVENIRRVSEVARLMTDAGLIVITAFISPFRNERESARALFPPGEFLEIFVDPPLAEAERRDPKGLYAKARRGDLKNFTGIDSPYERPESPEVTIDTTRLTAQAAAAKIVEELRLRGL